MLQTLPPNHFLSLPRPPVSHVGQVPDTSTLAAHDFDVDVRTGFMPPQPPIPRLSEEYSEWEDLLDEAIAKRLRLGSRSDAQNARTSAEWREKVTKMSLLPTDSLTVSETTLRRAHLVLAFILHFFVHSQPPVSDPVNTPIHIPRPLSIPLLQVSAQLVLPPLLTYADTVLYNWYLSPKPQPFAPVNPEHIRTQTSFSGTRDEEHFYLTSARIELRGSHALALLRNIEEEAFVGDLLSLQRISLYLSELGKVINQMTGLLNDVRRACDPAVFYNEIRPWFNGQSSDGRKWVFEGARTQPSELAGPSAGQSSIVHVLDIFLGVDQFSHVRGDGEGSHMRKSETSNGAPKKLSFLERMQKYMPRYHRAFLNHLRASQRPLRSIIDKDDELLSEEEKAVRMGLKASYNEAVVALKKFRDAHIRIATLYIINQARKTPFDADEEPEQAKGTGGTELIPFLKGVRDRTASAVLKN